MAARSARTQQRKSAFISAEAAAAERPGLVSTGVEERPDDTDRLDGRAGVEGAAAD